MIRLGVHCSLRDGFCGALEEARRLGCEAAQIFVRSPRMWRMRFPAETEIAEFLQRRRELDIRPLIVHTPYLPNLATSLQALYDRSLNALRDDLMLAEKLGADYLVIHPGSYSPGSSAAQGISLIAGALNEIMDAIPGNTQILLENVAGGGRRLGSSFAELSGMLELLRNRKRAGICFDTAHALGAGYDLSMPEGIDSALDECDRFLGLHSLKVIHFNDSMVPLASHRDRHQHLGEGYIGTAGFKYLMARLHAISVAGILETPKNSSDADSRNLKLLFRWREDAVSKEGKENHVD